MPKHSPFRVMCAMWGTKIAVQKAKEMGIEIDPDVLAEQEESDKRLSAARADLLKALLKARSRKKEDNKNG